MVEEGIDLTTMGTTGHCKEPPPHLPPSTMESFIFRGIEKKQDQRRMAKTFPCTVVVLCNSIHSLFVLKEPPPFVYLMK